MEPFTGIEPFARVVETGSFTAAAARLQTSKSSVSEAVKALEERLGVRLLDRTTRKVRATEAGRIFYERCRRLIEEAQAARLEAQTLQDAPAGRLRVAAPEAFAARYLVPGLSTFFAAYPAIDIELVEAVAAARLVEEGFDLAIRVSQKPEPNLVVRRIARSQVVVVASPVYLAAAGTPKAPRDLEQHRCVGFSPLIWRDTWRLGNEEVRIQPRLLANSAESMRAAALAGLGLVALPDWMVSDALAAGRLTRVLGTFRTQPSGIYAVFPTNRMITPTVRAYVDHVVRDLRACGMTA